MVTKTSDNRLTGLLFKALAICTLAAIFPTPGFAIDLHQINGFTANTGGIVTDWPVEYPWPDAPPPDPSVWDTPPMFDPGSITLDGFGDAFDAPGLYPVSPTGDSGFGGTSTVPEPTTLGLLALGGLTIARRRKRLLSDRQA